MNRKKIRDEFVRRFYRALARYEANIGRCATRTRQMIDRWGVIGTAKRLAAQRYVSAGFRSLGASGSIERAMVMQKFRILFTEQDVANARSKLRAMRNS